MELTKEQAEIVSKALNEYAQARLAVEQAGARLNDLCIAIAGPDYQLKPTGGGGFLLLDGKQTEPPKEKKRARKR